MMRSQSHGEALKKISPRQVRKRFGWVYLGQMIPHDDSAARLIRLPKSDMVPHLQRRGPAFRSRLRPRADIGFGA
jgi:hypothetical protein